MINLVSEKFKKDLKLDYRLRVLVVFGFLLLFVFLAGLVLLSLFYFILLSRGNDLDNFLSASGSGQAHLISMEKELALDKKRVDVILRSDNDNFKPGSVVKTILDITPSSVSVSNLNIEVVGSGRLQITLGGLFDNRNDLLSFIGNLRAIPQIVEVDSPVSNLVRDTGGAFSVNIIFEY